MQLVSNVFGQLILRKRSLNQSAWAECSEQETVWDQPTLLLLLSNLFIKTFFWQPENTLLDGEKAKPYQFFIIIG